MQIRIDIVHVAAARASVRRRNRHHNQLVARALLAPCADCREVILRRRDTCASKPRVYVAGEIAGFLFPLHTGFQCLNLVPSQLVLAHQYAVQICHRRRSLRRFAACLLNGFRRKAPFVNPQLVHLSLVFAGRAPLSQSGKQSAELLFTLLAKHDNLFDILNRAHAALRPFFRAPIRNLDGYAPAAVLHLDLKQHQHNLFRKLKHLHPVVNQIGFLRKERPLENTLRFLNKLSCLLIIQLISGVFGSCQRQLL